ncbi:MAG: hypothetical protein RMI91_01840 [Gemmatales bacterium]|nr:hypothetical protein [Gemmatales bacterium]MDW7993368.1 hypothetical protein [Gemmatales bacterium]
MRWHLVKALLLVFSALISPTEGVLGREQPAYKASVCGQTGTEASPTGSRPAPLWVFPDDPNRASHHYTHDQLGIATNLSRSCHDYAPSDSEITNIDQRDAATLPNWADAAKELAASLRAVAEAVRQFPDQVEQRWQLIQRTGAVAFAAGRTRGWLEGAAVTAVVILVLLVCFRCTTRVNSV